MDFIFKVDPIRRSIKVPDAFTVLTMDHNIHKLVFICPYYEDFAFDSASIVFMVDAPDGKQYSIPAEEYESFPNSPSPYVKFTLTLKSYITSVVGYMSFCITADIISSGNVIEKSWHTKNITISIGGHIDNDDSEDIPEEDVPTINQRLNNLDSKVGRLQTTVNGMANGSPTPVATVAEMTDESAVYLYTGSETGYTAGNWYYYNGSAWTSGGTYGGAVTSTTFNQHGVPADDFAVGEALAEKADADDVTDIADEIGDLSQLTTTAKDNLVATINQLNGRLTQLNALTKISFEEVSGYINVNGSIVEADSYKQEVYTNKILVNAGDVLRITLSYPIAYTIWAAYATYASDGTFIERVMLNASEPQTDFSADVTVPDGVSSIAFTYRTYGTGTSDIYMAYSVCDKFSFSADVRTFPGYFNPDGTIHAQTSTMERYTQKFDIALSDKWMWHLGYSTAQRMWVAMAVYDEDGAFLRRVILYQNSSTGVDIQHESTLPFEDGDKYFALCYRSYDDGEISVTGMVSNDGVANTVNDITLDISAIEQNIDGIKNNRENTLELPFRFKPLYDHLFVNRHEDNVTIPHESVYHVRHSRKMGFNTIEANVSPTSDGVFIVNHLINGKFGGYFHHVDGTTDITDIAVSSVTWDWIVQNVRYNSQIAKYQT